MTELFVLEGEAATWKQALAITAGKLLEEGCVCGDFYDCCVERELQYPTGLTDACPIAIPHTSSDHVKKQAICALRLKEPVAFRQIDDDEAEMHAKFVLNLALVNDSEHIDIMMNLMRFIKNRNVIDEMESATLPEFEKLLKNNILNKE
ncbi:PTS sugar transporter subunit IIA [Caproiciproducens sp.]